MYQLFDRVALSRDFREHGLKRGDVGTLIDLAPHPAGGPNDLTLAIMNALGETILQIVVTDEDVEPLRATHILAVRRRR